MVLGSLVDTLFLQLLVIILVSRIFGTVFQRYLSQPYVLGEMFAGVALGPSVLGAAIPSLEQYLFPQSSVPTLYVISQIGLVLYMFMVGLNFQSHTLSGQRNQILLTTVFGFFCPLIVGIAFAYHLTSCGLLKCAAPTWAVVLFFSTILTSTALPVLSRIIEELGIAKSRLGTRSLTVAATTDILDWIIITFAIAASHPPEEALLYVTAAVLAAILLTSFGKRAFSFLEVWYARDRGITQGTFALVISLLLAVLVIAGLLQIQPVFAAFAFGAVLPHGDFGRALHRKLSSLTIVVFLPIFLTFSGLNTKIWMLDSFSLWLITAFITLAACLSRIVGCAVAGRLCGESWRMGLGFGALMNSRGMIGLIILNMGLQIGYITQPLFTILAIMDLLTTLIARPMFLTFIGVSALSKLRTESSVEEAVDCTPIPKVVAPQI